MKITLSELEARAKSWAAFQDDAPVDPDDLMALIRVVRESRALVASGMYQGLFHDNLEDALKEIEA